MMELTRDALEEWALHCGAMGARISLDSSGAPAPYGAEWWRELDIEDRNNEGELEERLKDTLAHHYRVERERIALTLGAQHADFLFFLTQVEPFDLVGVENPTFIPLRKGAEMVCRSRVVRRDPDRDYIVDHRDLNEVLERGAKAIALTNLHNPSAARMSGEELAGVMEEAARYKALVLVDEVYREMDYGIPCPPAFELGENGVSVSSVTKLNGLRGLRIGWLIGPQDVAEKVEMARLYSSYRLPARNLALAAEAVKKQGWFRERALKVARRNLPVLREWLENEPRVSCRMPDGALMALLALPPGVDDLALSEEVLRRGVAVCPGRYFGAPRHIRVTFSCSTDELRTGLEVISSSLDAVH